ncbi:MAG: DoxX family protein [Actinocrinis sp.]
MRNPPSLNQHLPALYRIVLGLLIACHGAASLFGLFGGSLGSGKSISMAQWPGGAAADIQLVCGVLVLLGLVTRPAAVLLSGAMAYAYFTVHQKHALLPIQNGGEPAALFAWGFLMVAILGPGTISLDAALRRVRARAQSSQQPVAGEA